MKTTKLKIHNAVILGLLMAFTGAFVYAQGNGDQQYQTLEDLEDKNMVYFTKIYQITDDYPDFKYKFVYKDGVVTDVVVENVDDELERKRLEILIYDYKKNKELMKNVPTRKGIYYSVDREAEPEMGYREFYNTLYENIQYPAEAKDWGTEGNVYLQFVVKSNGEIGYMQATEDIETTQERYVEDLKKAAKKAVKATSGQWRPAYINDTPVASWAVLPVVFRIEAHPGVVQMVR